MPSGELYTAADAKWDREKEMKKRGYAIWQDFYRQGTSKAQARKIAKAANAIVRLLKPLSSEERQKALAPYA